MTDDRFSFTLTVYLDHPISGYFLEPEKRFCFVPFVFFVASNRLNACLDHLRPFHIVWQERTVFTHAVELS